MIGVLAAQATADSESSGLEVVDRNNMVIAPLNTVMRRFEDSNSFLKDEIDGIYIRVAPGSRLDRNRQRRRGPFWPRPTRTPGDFTAGGAGRPAGAAAPDAVHLSRWS